MALSPELLEMLSCPRCDAQLEEKKDKVVCKKCKTKFPIEDGVPNLLA